MKGSDLKALRTKLGLSQKEVADMLGYFSAGEPNRSQISRYENGYQNINQRLRDAIITNFKSEADKRMSDPLAIKKELDGYRL